LHVTTPNATAWASLHLVSVGSICGRESLRTVHETALTTQQLLSHKATAALPLTVRRRCSPATHLAIPRPAPRQAADPARLGERLRTLGIYAQPARRTAIAGLAARLPAAVLADLLHLHPTTAVRWVHDAGGDWNRYAAQLVHARDQQL
jgi:hypothetical protein